MIGYIELGLAIVMEVVGTNFMKASAGFTKLWPSLITIVAYVVCFYSLSQSLKTVNLSIAYATWGGLGIILTSLISVMIWHEHISLPVIAGIVFIVIGVILCNFFATSH